jgi:hypothetical protein
LKLERKKKRNLLKNMDQNQKVKSKLGNNAIFLCFENVGGRNSRTSRDNDSVMKEFHQEFLTSYLESNKIGRKRKNYSEKINKQPSKYSKSLDINNDNDNIELINNDYEDDDYNDNCLPKLNQFYSLNNHFSNYSNQQSTTGIFPDFYTTDSNVNSSWTELRQRQDINLISNNCYPITNDIPSSNYSHESMSSNEPNIDDDDNYNMFKIDLENDDGKFENKRLFNFV